MDYSTLPKARPVGTSLPPPEEPSRLTLWHVLIFFFVVSLIGLLMYWFDASMKAFILNVMAHS